MRLATKATHQQTRALQPAPRAAHALRLRADQPRGVARLTGLTRTTVGDVVGELIARAWSRRSGAGPRPAARPRSSSSSSTTPATSSASTSASSAFRAALVNLRGEVRRGRRAARRRPRRRRRARPRLRARRRAPRRVRATAPRHRRRHAGHRRHARPARSAGPSTSTGRTCRSAASSDERYGLPADVANDSQAAALADYLFGGDGRRAPTSSRSRSGAASAPGIVLNGELFQGDGFGAGEIGHVGRRDDGAECRCGRFGCLETVASSPGDRQRAAELAASLGRRSARRAATAS